MNEVQHTMYFLASAYRSVVIILIVDVSTFTHWLAHICLHHLTDD